MDIARVASEERRNTRLGGRNHDDAIAIMNEFGVSQLPVLSAEPPVVIGEVVGSLDESALLDSVFAGRVAMADSIASVTGDALPLIGVNETVGAARAALSDAGALLVTDGGKPVSVITRADLLAFLSR